MTPQDRAPGGELANLEQLEGEARRRGLLLRLQVRHPLALAWTLRVVVARRGTAAPGTAAALQLLGELKGWALPTEDGLRLDTLQVTGRNRGERDLGVAPLIAAASFAWALEVTPCRRARILAIRDGDRQHRRLVRYFGRLGFTPVRELGAAPQDLPARVVWGGTGLLMQGDCREGLRRSLGLLALRDPGPAAERRGDGAP